jgi:hypothetical protein
MDVDALGRLWEDSGNSKQIRRCRGGNGLANGRAGLLPPLALGEANAAIAASRVGSYPCVGVRSSW